jgi:C_GCAxxG_C_C family probable redox protein
MPHNEFVDQRVHESYWKDNINCATTTLNVLSEHFQIPLQPQTINAAIGMHGAGRFGAQCGLVEGALMFLGIYGTHHNLSKKHIADICYTFADEFQSQFGSLLCRELRPGGFQQDDPPHLCESLTRKTVLFALDFITNMEH